VKIKICLCQERVSLQEITVDSHQQFIDECHRYQEFLSAFQCKLQTCQVPAADQHAVQTCLDRVNVSFLNPASILSTVVVYNATLDDICIAPIAFCKETFVA